MIMLQNITSVFDGDNGLCSVIFPAHSLPLFGHLILSWGSVTVFTKGDTSHSQAWPLQTCSATFYSNLFSAADSTCSQLAWI